MQFRFFFTFERPLTLPLGYHHMLQGLIYHMILDQNPEYSAFLHDKGYGVDHHFKLFCFSLIHAPAHKVHAPYITFYREISFELRSPVYEFNQAVLTALGDIQSLEFNNQKIIFSHCEISHHRISQSDVQIKMISPLTMSTTYYDNDKKKTRYISPIDEDFNDAFVQNTIGKLKAAGFSINDKGIKISPVSIDTRDKYVTRFDDRIYITAWNGIYQLTAPSDVISFLYDAGIGSRNSQGFGMFDLK